MAVNKISISDFLEQRTSVPVLDVRSPGEYAQAHIPGARSFPLFSDAERREIGTAYKQLSKQTAIKIGLEAFGKNLVKMVEQAEALVPLKSDGSRAVIVHCWRGGMRSAAVAWLLDLYGFQVFLLEGGYKSYRRWALKQFDLRPPLRVLGGYTGSNKTGLLQLLKQRGEAVIDLEELAAHKGSAFGNLERHNLPSQEQFENHLALELHRCHTYFPNQHIWIELESQRIGQINLPLGFYNYFANLPLYVLDVPFEERLRHLVKEYGTASKESLINAIVRITKKLGGLEAKTAINCLMDNDTAGCFAVLLHYYDKLYHKHEAKRHRDQTQSIHIACPGTDAATNLKKLLDHVGN